MPSKERYGKIDLSFNTTRKKWEIKNKINKKVLFSFDCEFRAQRMFNTIENYPFINERD